MRESVLKKPVVSPSFSKVWGSERLFLLRCSLSGVVSLPGFGKVEGTKKESSSGVFFFSGSSFLLSISGKKTYRTRLTTFLSSRPNQSKGLEGNGGFVLPGRDSVWSSVLENCLFL